MVILIEVLIVLLLMTAFWKFVVTPARRKKK